MSETTPLSEQAQVARQVLQEMLSAMQFPGTVEVEATEEAEQIVLAMHSDQPLALLIGKGGQTLNALELIVGQITSHKLHEHGKRIVVDAEGYRQRQTERLQQVARDAAKRVQDAGESVSLDPMNARDRRTVHMTLMELGGVETYSEGEEPYRHIVVTLPGQQPGEAGE